MKYVLFLFGIMVFCTVARGQENAQYIVSFLTGEQLHDKCKDFEQKEGDSHWLAKAAYCDGYIQAHFEALSYEDAVSRSSSPSATQLVAIVNKYLGAHPEKWAWPASGLVRSALVGAFPAPKKN